MPAPTLVHQTFEATQIHKLPTGTPASPHWHRWKGGVPQPTSPLGIRCRASGQAALKNRCSLIGLRTNELDAPNATIARRVQLQSLMSPSQPNQNSPLLRKIIKFSASNRSRPNRLSYDFSRANDSLARNPMRIDWVSSSSTQRTQIKQIKSSYKFCAAPGMILRPSATTYGRSQNRVHPKMFFDFQDIL